MSVLCNGKRAIFVSRRAGNLHKKGEKKNLGKLSKLKFCAENTLL